ncbi:chorismate mutase [Herbaspirillum sp. Sphag1AN]|uniref:gamma subclass chorismate mutase AroQ n=1 Tax=unclassified Herbaspirillum TaxID=2624150 RepID=UPI00160E8F14|nr:MULTISPECIES: gamma subclass chorismate mutase AroQ [unclassified Herbaspirillum]MBB3212017.1 chorismate mutase [Herbaspirillum sp. Sphag1AN]MBB3244149.1 chorismate mutase [Herbaspirillum sp. Sphag64]
MTVRNVAQTFCGLLCVVLSLAGCQVLPPEQSGASATSIGSLSALELKEIDHLLELINQRLAVAEKVAQAKWNSGAPIDDPLRERKILADLAAGMHDAPEADRSFALRFFQAQFDAGKIIQRDMHAQWQKQQHSPFAQPPDLARDIRPELDRLTPLLIDTLHRVRPLLMQAEVRDYLAARSLQLIALHDGNIDAARDEAVSILLQP